MPPPTANSLENPHLQRALYAIPIVFGAVSDERAMSLVRAFATSG
jgi:hypothetical protein